MLEKCPKKQGSLDNTGTVETFHYFALKLSPMKIRDAKLEDVDQVYLMISNVIRECVVKNDADHESIMNHIRSDIDWLRGNIDESICFVCEVNDRIVGVINVINNSNLRHLFVLPEFQRKGIASGLVDAAVKRCKSIVSRGTLKLNSSTVAAPFYERYGFIRSGEEKLLPGGCVPFIYEF